MKVEIGQTNPNIALNPDPANIRNCRRQIEPPEVQNGVTAHIAKTAGVSRTAAGSDVTDISGVAPSISALAAAVQASPDVRQARVEALRDAIGQGTYQISPQRIAESMLAQATSKLR